MSIKEFLLKPGDMFVKKYYRQAILPDKVFDSLCDDCRQIVEEQDKKVCRLFFSMMIWIVLLAGIIMLIVSWLI